MMKKTGGRKSRWPVPLSDKIIHYNVTTIISIMLLEHNFLEPCQLR